MNRCDSKRRLSLSAGAPGRERIVPQPNDAEETAKPCAQKHSAANTPTSKTASSTQTNASTVDSPVSVGLRYADPIAKRRLKRCAAKGGDAVGMFRLGVLCLNGKGVSKDSAAAREWFEAAASLGL